MISGRIEIEKFEEYWEDPDLGPLLRAYTEKFHSEPDTYEEMEYGAMTYQELKELIEESLRTGEPFCY